MPHASNELESSTLNDLEGESILLFAPMNGILLCVSELHIDPALHSFSRHGNAMISMVAE